MNARKYSHGFRKLRAWQEAHSLAIDLHQWTKGLPQEERYRLTDQIRRASRSVSALIAEGSCMLTQKHQCTYYMRAHGSVGELDNHLEFAHDVRLMEDTDYNCFLARINFVASLVLGMVRSTQTSFPRNSRTPQPQNLLTPKPPHQSPLP